MLKRLAVPLLGLFLQSCASSPLAGAWRSKVQFTSGDFTSVQDLEFLYAFTPTDSTRGTLTESSNYDGAPPVPPAYGAWVRRGDRQFEAKYIFYTTKPGEEFDQGFGPSGRGELTELITVAPNGETFESTLALQLYDKAGAPIAGGGAGQGRGIRIRP